MKDKVLQRFVKEINLPNAENHRKLEQHRKRENRVNKKRVKLGMRNTLKLG